MAVVALGSNLGDRRGAIEQALARLAAEPHIRVQKVSTLIETTPVGGPQQGDYLNGACVLETELAPRALLDRLLAIETALGRVRTTRWGARTIDLDLIFFGDTILDEPGLAVPHPRAHERLFVLGPLYELVPDFRHPRLGLTVAELYERLTAA